MSKKISIHTESKCFFCEKSFTNSNFKTREHIWPKVLGGPNSRPNIVACCKQCNDYRAALLNKIRKRTHTKNEVEYIRDCCRLFYYRMWHMYKITSKSQYIKHNNANTNIHLCSGCREPFNKLSSSVYDQLYGGKERPSFYAVSLE